MKKQVLILTVLALLSASAFLTGCIDLEGGIEGVLEQEPYPVTSQYIPTCMVWVVNATNEIYYLTKNMSPQCSMDELLNVGDNVRVKGEVHYLKHYTEDFYYQCLEIEKITII